MTGEEGDYKTYGKIRKFDKVCSGAPEGPFRKNIIICTNICGSVMCALLHLFCFLINQDGETFKIVQYICEVIIQDNSKEVPKYDRMGNITLKD